MNLIEFIIAETGKDLSEDFPVFYLNMQVSDKPTDDGKTGEVQHHHFKDVLYKPISQYSLLKTEKNHSE